MDFPFCLFSPSFFLRVTNLLLYRKNNLSSCKRSNPRQTSKEHNKSASSEERNRKPDINGFLGGRSVVKRAFNGCKLTVREGLAMFSGILSNSQLQGG